MKFQSQELSAQNGDLQQHQQFNNKQEVQVSTIAFGRLETFYEL